MTRYKAILIILALAAFAASGFAQVVLTGIGLSSSPTDRDTVVVNGDTVHVTTSFTVLPFYTTIGAAVDRDSLFMVRVQYFADSLGEDTNLVQVRTVSLIPGSSVLGPNSLSFRIRLTDVTNSRIKAMQIEMGIAAEDTNGIISVNTLYTSHTRILHSNAVGNPVDFRHATYLVVRDTRTYPITFVSPLDATTFGRTLRIVYNQTEDALGGTLTLTITNPNEDRRILYLRNRAGGNGKILNLNWRSLSDVVQVDSMAGDTFLLDGERYRLVLSYQDINHNPPAADTLDRLTADFFTEPVAFEYPNSGDTLGSRFRIVYDQGEDAQPRSLVLSILTQNESTRLIYLNEPRAGVGKTLHLNAFSLFDTLQMDSMTGPNTLTNGTHYEFSLSYQDLMNNPIVVATRDSVLLDLSTLRPVLYEPRIGSSTTDSTVYFLYNLPEAADSVMIRFAEDTSGSVIHDSLSPHVITMAPAYNGPGLVSFYLDGRNIGTNNPMVIQSNRGPDDRLVAGSVYRVTLIYGDVPGNDTVSVSNTNYVWPRDNLTIKPRLLTPPDSTRVPSEFRVEFLLPEAPMPGSVRLRLAALNDAADPGSPHLVYFTVRTPGLNSLVLNGANLHSSGVDSVTGDGNPAQNNILVNGLLYNLTISYRDSIRNPESNSERARVIFDTQTELPTIYSPLNGSALPRSDLIVDYNQPEDAIPGTLQLILLQTGGPDVDLGSPHILYLHNSAAGNHKGIVVQPASLGSSTPIDSSSGGQSLIPRGIYRLTLQYRDLLGNSYGLTNVDSLYYSSGASVTIRGTPIGSGVVVPGDTALPIFRISLRTDGGESVLRGIHFQKQGTATARDVDGDIIRLWMSVDSILSPDDDHVVKRIRGWTGGDITFDSFAVALGVNEIHFFVTCGFLSSGNPAHRINVILNRASDVDCGGDPVLSDQWPIGTPDVMLAVELTSFTTAQDTSIGALRVLWTVASETNNAGFMLARRADGDSVFQDIASYANDPALAGQGSSSEAHSYQYRDHGLIPGTLYYYKLSAVSDNFDIVEFDSIAAGIPRIPPDNFVLADAYPNPFNQTVNIRYFVPYTSRVELTVYDLLGREVRQLVKAIQPASDYQIRWDGCDNSLNPVPSGLYFYRMMGGGRFDQTKKLLLVR